MSLSWNASWPRVTTYKGAHLRRVALPLGGIGTGTVSLGGRGDLRDWEVVNRPAKGFVPRMEANAQATGPCFVIYAKAPGEEAVARALEGPLDPVDYAGGSGCPVANHGLPRFREAQFGAAYPFAQVRLQDKALPVSVRLEAFNPLIPGDAERSGMPVAVLRYVVKNLTDKRVTVALCGSVPNFIGQDGSQQAAEWSGDPVPTGACDNKNTYRAGEHLRGIFMHSDGVPMNHEAWGTLALATTARQGISSRTAWAQRRWGDSLVDFWDDLLADGELDERDAGHTHSPMGSLAVRFPINPGKTRAVTFILSWHFPNRMTWSPEPTGACGCEDGDCAPAGNCIGNYYTSRYQDAWEAAEDAAAHLDVLENDTRRFVRALCDTELPAPVTEAALYNLSTLRSQTCFRTPDGRFYGWEGCHDNRGCCPGSCTHVWNYEQATAFLFGELAWTMREVEFAHATDAEGAMCFRVHLPLDRGTDKTYTAADGQMGCLMKLYREWQLSGDDEALARLWPEARRALEFCWIDGGWDADADGVMEGCQHNTMDVEYYGPNPQMQSWYLGALRAAAAMARHLGEDAFADHCANLATRGAEWTDQHLFNGDYYEQEIRPMESADQRHPSHQMRLGAEDPTKPVLQLGAGCLVDQLVGQYMAHICGLGYLLERQHVRRALRSIMAYNRKQGFHDHFNHMRSYAMGDETGLLMASYPRGRRPDIPFPYYNEAMTGFEYSTAVHMIYEGQEMNGLHVIEDVRRRYCGLKRNPFDEAECGHHYARAMASWGAVVALIGFRYSAVTRTMGFQHRDGTWFWSNGYAWGTATIKTGNQHTCLRLEVLYGSISISRLELGTKKAVDFEPPRKLAAMETVDLRL